MFNTLFSQNSRFAALVAHVRLAFVLRLMRYGVRHQGTAVAEAARTLRTRQRSFGLGQMVLIVVLQDLGARHHFVANRTLESARLEMARHMQRHHARHHQFEAATHDVAFGAVNGVVVLAQRGQVDETLRGSG